GALIPERLGGSGMGVGEVVIVLEELGTALAAVPYLGSAALAATLLLTAGDEQASARYLPGIAPGEGVACAGPGAPRAVPPATRPGPEGWLLSGETTLLPDLATASVLFVFAAHEADLGIYAMPLDADGLTVASASAYDATRQLSRVRLDAVRGDRL